MMELTEDFVKWMQIAIAVVGILTIFLLFVSYNIKILHSELERETYYLGDHLLGSKCLTLTDGSNVIKSKFSESKLDTIEADPSCINYPKGEVIIELINCGSHPNCDWIFDLNPAATYEGQSAIFILAVKMNDGSIEPARMTVTM